MKSLLKYGMLSVLVLSLNACGAKDKKGDTTVNTQETGNLSNGKYFLGSATIEGFDTAGNRLNTVTLQVTGQYSWTMTSLGGERYELIATGNAKLLSNNQVAAEFICSGSRDVAQFQLTGANAVSDLRVTESGCPQGLGDAVASQMTIEALSSSTFVLTHVEIGNGTRIVSTFTFNKR